MLQINKTTRKWAVTFLMATAMILPAMANERQEKIFKVSGIPSVSVRNISGTIEIRTWNQREVKIEAILSNTSVQAEMTQVGDTIRVVTRNPNREYSFWGRGGSVDYLITMPVEGNLEANCVSGRVTVSGVQGDLNVESVSGDVEIQNVGKRLWAKSVSGDISVTQGQVDVEAKSVSGDVTLSDLSGRLSAGSVSGNIRLQRTRSSRVVLETTSGDVEMDAELEKGGNYRINSHSGYIGLRLSRSASFEISARTFSGQLDTDLPLTMTTPEETGRRHGRTLRGKYGNGEAIIDVETFSGDVRLINK
jgi:DUF4097 and DUF4098 domain-containing protein YvlB